MTSLYKTMCGCAKPLCYYDGVTLAHDAGYNLAYTEPAPTIPAALTAHSRKMQASIYCVAENVFCAVGYACANIIFVAGDDGIIVCDVTESSKVAAQVLSDFRACAPQFAQMPVKAVIYTHNHLDHVGGIRGMVNEEDVVSGAVNIIAHRSLMTVMNNNTGLVGPAISTRALYTFGSLLQPGPEGRVNLGLGPAMMNGAMSFLAPTITFDDALDMTIAGVRLQFRYAPSEADDEIVIWLPDKQLLLSAEVVQGECFANVHTIRGTLYRDPVKWVNTLDMMRRFGAQHMVPAHGRPVSGAAQVEDLLCAYRDSIAYMHDQAIRLMNLGATPDELAEQIPALPAHLKDHAWLGEHYGAVKHCVRQVFNGQLGWFEGDPTFIDPLPRKARAERTLKLMGGRDAVFAAAQEAMQNDEGEDGLDGARWAAELLTFVLRETPKDEPALLLKAAALRRLGFSTVNANWRNWYLTSALELDGGLAKLVAANPRLSNLGGGGFAHPDFIRSTSAFEVLKRWCVRVNPQKAGQKHLVFGWRFTDTGLAHAMELRRGVLQIHPTLPEKVDTILVLTTPVFWTIMRKLAEELPKAFQAGQVSLEKGEPYSLMEFFSSFDPLPTSLPVMTLR